jgi:hypothetical protein
MMKTRRVYFMALAVAMLWSVAAADEPAAKCPAAADCPHCQAHGQDTHGPVSALLELRKLFGDPLAGTALEAAKDCEECDFADAVTRVAEMPEAVQFALPPDCDADVYQAATSWVPPQQAYAATLPPPAVAGTPSEGQRVFIYTARAPNDVHVKLLRQSARQLEFVASDLEDLGLYEKADELRKSAVGLRELARGQSQARLHVHGTEY